jgi:hypothetical protein
MVKCCEYLVKKGKIMTWPKDNKEQDIGKLNNCKNEY